MFLKWLVDENNDRIPVELALETFGKKSLSVSKIMAILEKNNWRFIPHSLSLKSSVALLQINFTSKETKIIGKLQEITKSNCMACDLAALLLTHKNELHQYVEDYFRLLAVLYSQLNGAPYSIDEE
jgi:hypothetical protein